LHTKSRRARLELDITLFISTVKDIKDTVVNLQSEVIKDLELEYLGIHKEENLTKMLSNITDKTRNRFIIIIDEWDALFREAEYDTDLQKEYVQLLRSLFKSTLTDKVIKAAYMTGISSCSEGRET
jgi:Cdc6-like AAA superfamily ATPase